MSVDNYPCESILNHSQLICPYFRKTNKSRMLMLIYVHKVDGKTTWDVKLTHSLSIILQITYNYMFPILKKPNLHFGTHTIPTESLKLIIIYGCDKFEVPQ